MIVMEHVRRTRKIEYLSEFASTAAEEHGVSDKVGIDLHPKTAEAIGSLILERALDLEMRHRVVQPEESM